MLDEYAEGRAICSSAVPHSIQTSLSKQCWACEQCQACFCLVPSVMPRALHTFPSQLHQQAVSIGGVVSCMCYRHNEEEFQMVSELFSSLPGSKWVSRQ